MPETFFLSDTACSRSRLSKFDMLHDFPPSHYESDAMFSTFHDGVLTGNDHDCPVSPHSVLDCLPVEVPLKSPPPLQSGFLVWSPKTRGLEFARFSPPVSPHFGGRSRFPSEASTLSTTSTDSSGLYGDASDREDDLEDFVWPPVPPPTPFSFEGAAPENAEAPALPAATTIQFLENPPTPHPYLWRSHKENLYKTKPCKFFFKDRSCIKGDKCNFIHDEWDRAHRTPRPWYERRTLPPARPLSSMGRRHANDTTRQPHPTTPRPTDLHMLPQKPAEDAQRVCSPNYYPITWRVIGGGVMMSGRREICQEFMAGRCHDGIDCKDAHPGAGDDDEDTSFNSPHSYMSPLSPVQEEPAYIPHNPLPPFMLSPASSVCSPVLCSPIMSAVPAQPPVYPEERRRRGRRARKPLTIIPPPLPEQPEVVSYSAHRVLDGRTLRELEASPPPASAMPDLSPDHLDVESVGRALVRPLSTPPSLNGPRLQVAKLFAAEMP